MLSKKLSNISSCVWTKLFSAVRPSVIAGKKNNNNNHHFNNRKGSHDCSALRMETLTNQSLSQKWSWELPPHIIISSRWLNWPLFWSDKKRNSGPLQFLNFTSKIQIPYINNVNCINSGLKSCENISAPLL